MINGLKFQEFFKNYKGERCQNELAYISEIAGNDSIAAVITAIEKHKIEKIYSFGNLKTKADLLNALSQILKYKENKQLKTNYSLSPDQILMSVIIQQWLNTIVGGVLFTRSPNNFNNSDILIEYEFNGSDGVTSGKIKPYRLIVPRNEILEYHLFRKRFKNINLIKRIKFKVFFQFLKQCISLEDFLEYPLDIEFLINWKGIIYFTQLRPINKRNII